MSLPLLERVDGGATFSDDRRYRFSLWRTWGEGEIAHFCMLNPSIADEHDLDPTLRRVKGFVERWGMAGFVITNLFPLVATDPRDLIRCADRNGPETGARPVNHDHIKAAALSAAVTVLGWGTNAGKTALRGAVPPIYGVLKEHAPQALRVSRAGHPIHPLYLPYDCELGHWSPA